MTKIEKRIQDEHNLPVPAIKALARAFSRRPDDPRRVATLDYEDLVCEGFKLGIQLKREMTKDAFKFSFRTCLKNHFRKIIRRAETSKRKAILINLDEDCIRKYRSESSWQTTFPETEYEPREEEGGQQTAYLEHKIRAMNSMLSPAAKKVLAELISPSEKTVAVAIEKHREQNRKHRAKENKLRRSWRITDTLIRQGLNLSVKEFESCTDEIRTLAYEV